MDNLAGVRLAASKLTSFVEDNVQKGQTYENQATFNILLDSLANEVKLSCTNGVKFEEVFRVLQEEGKPIADSQTLKEFTKALEKSAREWNKTRRDKKGIVMN
jgi:hypothetical protein